MDWLNELRRAALDRGDIGEVILLTNTIAQADDPRSGRLCWCSRRYGIRCRRCQWLAEMLEQHTDSPLPTARGNSRD